MAAMVDDGESIPLGNVSNPLPAIAITTTPSQSDLQAPTPSTNAGRPAPQEQQSPGASTASTPSLSPSPSSTPTTPDITQNSSSSSLQPRPCSTLDTRSDTLVASTPSRISSPIGTQDALTQSNRAEHTSQRQSPIFAPWSSMWLANIIAISVLCLTVITLVYAHRADVMSKLSQIKESMQTCSQTNYEPRGCEKWRNVSLPGLRYISVDFPNHVKGHTSNLRKRFWNSSRSDQRDIDQIRLSGLIVAGLVALLFAGGILLQLYRPRRLPSLYPQEQSINSIARSTPTSGLYGTAAPMDDERKSNLRQRMRTLRAFVPAEDALSHLKAAKNSRSSSITVLEERNDNGVYRRASWVHHEAPPYNNDDYFFFSSGTASSDPWDFKHKKEHREHGGTHKWCHSPQYKIGAQPQGDKHVSVQELPSLTNTDTATTTTSESTLAAENRFRKFNAEHLKSALTEDSSDSEDSETSSKREHWKQSLYSACMRSDPPMFSPVNIKPGKVKPGIAFVGCVAGATVGGSAMLKVPMKVPLDECAADWMRKSLHPYEGAS
ncbi:MAG: hypothetical protein M1820_008426 [Bogoriella megaspora]|nr:MAG: hypothetical protein M1820_008426 [Bogoriella megaspora]